MERDEFIEFLNVKVTDSNPKKDDKELSKSKFETEYNEVYLYSFLHYNKIRKGDKIINISMPQIILRRINFI